MPRTKRKLKGRSKSHIRHVKAEHRKRVRAAGGTRTAASRKSRRLRRLAKARTKAVKQTPAAR